MKMTLWILLAIVMGTKALGAETPMDAPLKEDEITLIECSLDQDMTGPIEAKAGTYHYRLYIPKGYHADPQARYPLLFIASPGGDAQMNQNVKRLSEDQWIVAMLVESKNGISNSIAMGNCAAAHDDVLKRVRVIRDFICITGFSGGARVSSMFAAHWDGFKGVLLQAAGFAGAVNSPEQNLLFTKYTKNHLFYFTFGNTDFNLVQYHENECVRRRLPLKCPRQFVVFEGGHGVCPESEFSRALDWFERESILSDAVKKDADEARIWYGRRLVERLAQLDSADESQAYSRYLLIQDLLELAKLAKWTRDKSKKDEIEGWKSDLKTLKATAQIKMELKAQAEFEKVLPELEKAFAGMLGGVVVFQASAMQPQELVLIGKMITKLEDFCQKYPGTAAAQEAAHRVASLKMEFPSCHSDESE